MAEIPEVRDSGATGEQEEGNSELVHPNQQTLFPQPIAETIQGLAASNARNLGGVVVAGLVSVSFSQLAHELQDAKSDLRNTRKELSTSYDELSACRTRVAVLEERVTTDSRQKHLRNVAIAGGSMIVGLALQLDPSTLGALPIVLGGLDACLS